MLTKHASAVCTSTLFCLVLLTSCTKSPPAITTASTPTRTVVISPTVPLAPTVSATSATTPTHYTARVLLPGKLRPDDLAFDAQGHLLFSDFYGGTVSRLNAYGSVAVLVSGLAGPDGMFPPALALSIIPYPPPHPSQSPPP